MGTIENLLIQNNGETLKINFLEVNINANSLIWTQKRVTDIHLVKRK